jgi:hypothetical protein
MAVGFEAKLTDLAAGILRDALQVYEPSESERLLVGFNPIISATGAFPAITGSFGAVTGSVPTPTDTWQPPALSGATGTFRAVTGSFRALTESFRAIGQEPIEPTVTFRRIFKLPSRLPGVQLPPEAELVLMARSAPTLAELESLARWLGTEGRLLNDSGELTGTDVADASQQLGISSASLSFLWEYALASRWIELADSANRRRTWAVTGETAWRWADGDDQGTLHVWAVVFAAAAARALDVMAAAAPEPARKLNFQGQGVVVPVMLFLATRSGMTTGDIGDLIREGTIGEHPRSRLKRAWDAWGHLHGDPASHLLRELARLNAVTLPRTPGGTVQLTPLALWALREQFLLEKISVRVLPPPSPRMSAADLVALSEAVSDAEFETAFTIWMHGRTPERAVQELLMYAGSSRPHERLTAVDIARRVGVPGYRVWKDAMKRPELRGYARITLAKMASDLPKSTLPLVLDPDPGDMTWLATDLLALACGADNPDPDEIAAQFAEAVPAGEETWIFGLMAYSSHPDVARVLDVLSMYHPDRRVARDARKAARAMAKSRRGANRRRVLARAARP